MGKTGNREDVARKKISRDLVVSVRRLGTDNRFVPEASFNFAFYGLRNKYSET